MSEPGENRLAAARERMAEISRKFLERSQHDLATMRQALHAAGPSAAAGMDELRHLSHRMAGTGATVGFDAVSDLALHIETLAGSCVPDTVPDEATRAALDAALDALELELRQRRGDA
jgi:HPt (histidine-containing phosphotransfer) domain-containing protein